MKPIIAKQTGPAAESVASSPPVRWTLASLALAMLLSSLGTSIANVGLPTLARVFNASFQQVQWVVLAYLLTVTSLVVGAGRLGDLTGRRRLMLAGISVFTAGSALCALAPALPLLIAARAVQGAGAAVMMALTMAFVAGTVPKDRTGSAMGLLGTMSAVGTALGPTLGGALIAWFGWPTIFHVNVPLGMLALLLAYRFLPADRPAPAAGRAGFDHAGTLLLALSLAAYALAMTVGRDGFSAFNAGLFGAALCGAGLFVRAEAKAGSPLIPLAMFADPVLKAGFAMSALATTVVMATLIVGPFYLSAALALDAARVGLVMSSGPVAAALAGVPAGRLVDRFGAARATMAGLIAMAAGAALLPAMAAAYGVPGYIAPLAIVTAGYALFQAANNTAVMADVRPDRRGVVSGLLNLSRNMGLVTGASAMGAVYALGSAGGAPAETAASGMRLTFAVATGLIIAALAVASFRRGSSVCFPN